MELRGIDPRLLPYAEEALKWARNALAGAGIDATITVTSVRRSWQRQQELREKWESCVARGEPTPPCAYPANRPGDSAHNYGWAWDSVIDPPEAMDWWVRVREAFGWRVPPNDLIHAEVPDWRRYA